MRTQRKADFLFKVALVGCSTVGKSSILRRLNHQEFIPSSEPTLGVNFGIRTFEVDGSVVKLQIWDIGAKKEFRPVVKTYYNGAQAVFFVFDTTDRSSFEAIDEWIREVETVNKANIVKVLIGNKCDLLDMRMISCDEAEAYALDRGMNYSEVSALHNFNIEEVFNQAASRIKETTPILIQRHQPQGFSIQSVQSSPNDLCFLF
eukprot:TRINITY_DN3942_c0_g2_i1.p1 TRINITY_DN3942_c0_g2~~TRINITY_DN3942_c0_g2_i1.p1  ORF type:complete len:204 (-),score=54.49 TRINITY_DN3942_c0_g2_i1:54-665(-)